VVETDSHFVVRRELSRASFGLNLQANWSHRKSAHQIDPKEGFDMRADRIAMSFALATGCGVAVQAPAFSQDYQGTMEQQLACTPDVFRLCGDQIPDANRIVVCLRQNTLQLSRPCRAVFDSNASVQPQATQTAQKPRERRSWGAGDQ
jgi:hypothetical protein